MSEALVELSQVSKTFGSSRGAWRAISGLLGAEPKPTVKAVSRIDLAVRRGEAVGLVGESGCGKSTLARIVAAIAPASSGRVLFHGKDVATLTGKELKDYHLSIQMVFQDPMASLNPRKPVMELIGEAPRVHGLVSSRQTADYVAELLAQVGLPASVMRRFAHEFSGGQRTRIAIARSLAVRPAMLVCDEATASLDVSIQAQVLNLFMELRQRLGLAYLFVSHDLSVVRHVSDRIAVMYLGRIIEFASAERLFERPFHPYTRGLLAEAPRLDNRQRRFSAIKGELPSPLRPPPGCHFHPRCRFATERCRQEAPMLRDVGEGHRVACHFDLADEPLHAR